MAALEVPKERWTPLSRRSKMVIGINLRFPRPGNGNWQARLRLLTRLKYTTLTCLTLPTLVIRLLDVRSANVHEVMISRLDLARQKGCDGVEPDNMDGYTNNSGFSLSANDQLAYIIGLSITESRCSMPNTRLIT